MRRMLLACAGVVLLASDSGAVSLTITPDKPVYEVGEAITLDVFGDPGVAIALGIFGSVRFDPGLARYVSSSQSPLTQFGGVWTWTLGSLSGGPGFGQAFNQIGSNAPIPPGGPLVASVVLEAMAPGILEIAWDTSLDFFGLTDAPGTRVTIVPEPEAGRLLAFGLGLILAAQRRARCR